MHPNPDIDSVCCSEVLAATHSIVRQRSWVLTQYCSVKARDTMNRRLYNNQSFVETAIYRIFGDRY
ncbi:hypothetical protein [Nostoc sp. DSM 114159]